MKARLINSFLVLMFLFGVSASNVFGQTAASANWYLDQADSTSPNVIIGNLSPNYVAGSDSFFFAKYFPFTAQATDPLPGDSYGIAWWPGYDATNTKISWGLETAQKSGRYVQLAVSPKAGNSFSADTISICLAGGGTGLMRANLYYSTDPQFFNPTLLNPSDTGLVLTHATNVGLTQYIYPVTIQVNNGQSLYVRIFPWYTGSMSNSKYLVTQDAYIAGTTTPVTAVKETTVLPKVYSLAQNYPNPFNPSTQISFSLEKAGMTKLDVYNLLGQKVASLVNANLAAGQHSVNFNADNLPSGMYIYTLNSGSYSVTKKMVLLK